MKKIYILSIPLALALMTGCAASTAVSSASAAGTTASTAVQEENSYETVTSLMSSQITTRVFTGQSISDDDEKKILTSAFYGATSGGQQAREIIAVDDKSIMKQIQAVHPWAQSLDTAPLVIVIAGNQAKSVYPENLVQDTSIAAQNIVLTASSLGISTNIMSIYPQEKRMEGIQSALQLPDTVVPYIMVSMGYAQEDTSSSGSAEKEDTDAMIHYNTWSEN